MTIKKKTIAFITAGIVLLAVFAFDYSLAPQHEILVDNEAVSDAEAYGDAVMTPTMPVIISKDRAAHILHGDGVAGGHLYGTGTPCKSEFPEEWDDKRILDVTRKIAANDNLQWKRESNGYYVTEALEGDVRVRVVIGPQKQRVITAYPVNVARNPCPLRASP
ncbi:MAG: EndoU domain-containing protein [Alphaproteobacteria bacterium]|nr:EndoU domain-containing protein [Alphaproteobacteria bacterium]